MKVAVFGATGGVGRHATRILLERGHGVVAFVRSVDKLGDLAARVAVVRGDLADHEAVIRTVEDVDAVIWAVGATVNRESQPPLFCAALECALEAIAETTRIIIISGGAARVPGDVETFPRRVGRTAMGIFMKHGLATNDQQAKVAFGSSKRWTIVRPGMMPERRSKGPIVGSLGKMPLGSTTKEDVARFMVDAIHSETWLRRAPFVAPPR